MASRSSEPAIRSSRVRGLNVLSEAVPSFHSVALGMVFNQGSRDEATAEQGLTHVAEHMLFKGTRRKTAGQLARTIESIGGMINGFTHKESTGIYVRFMAEHFDLVANLLLEVLNESRFGSKELAREREVVAEEIKSDHEDPEDDCVDLLFKAAYGDHPLAAPISGELATVVAFTRSRVKGYYDRNYGRDRAVLAAAGDIDHEKLVRKFDRGLRLPAVAAARTRAQPARPAPGVRTRERKEISQVFVCLAKPAIPYPDRRRTALSVMNAVFGASTSSRLFQRLREDEGLVYSVSSFAELFSDAGLFGVFLVTDRKKLDRALTVVREEWNRLVRRGLTARELETARNYTKGAMILSQESLTSRMMRLAHSQLLLGRPVTLEEKLDEVKRLTRVDVHGLLHELGPCEDLYVSAVGPIQENELKQLI